MYYPKSQIVPNLYTNGEEYVYAVNSKEYIGNYFATADGKFLQLTETMKRTSDGVQNVTRKVTDVTSQFKKSNK